MLFCKRKQDQNIYAAIAAILDTLNFAYSTNFDKFAFLLCTSRTFKTSFMSELLFELSFEPKFDLIRHCIPKLRSSKDQILVFSGWDKIASPM